mgnify:CR=1 FL=1
MNELKTSNLTKSNRKDLKIGLLGGGQLGRMVIQEAISYNIDIHVMDEDPNAPSKSIAKSFTVGSLTDYQSVLDFGFDKDVITVEIENVNIDALAPYSKNN